MSGASTADAGSISGSPEFDCEARGFWYPAASRRDPEIAGTDACEAENRDGALPADRALLELAANRPVSACDAAAGPHPAFPDSSDPRIHRNFNYGWRRGEPGAGRAQNIAVAAIVPSLPARVATPPSTRSGAP
jgi:hypothetical protein